MFYLLDVTMEPPKACRIKMDLSNKNGFVVNLVSFFFDVSHKLKNQFFMNIYIYIEWIPFFMKWFDNIVSKELNELNIWLPSNQLSLNVGKTNMHYFINLVQVSKFNLQK